MSKTNKLAANTQAEDMLREIISGKSQIKMPAPGQLDPPVQPKVSVNKETNTPIWNRKESKTKTTVRRCIVIDRDDHWHSDAMVDLKGIDSTSFTWGYYGAKLPVLVESIKEPGTLNPWIFMDAVGESSNRLFKGANPDGYKSAFKHRGNMLQKITIGLLVGLVLGMIFIMYILINN
jgi:hypothetical protein